MNNTTQQMKENIKPNYYNIKDLIGRDLSDVVKALKNKINLLQEEDFCIIDSDYTLEGYKQVYNDYLRVLDIEDLGYLKSYMQDDIKNWRVLSDMTFLINWIIASIKSYNLNK